MTEQVLKAVTAVAQQTAQAVDIDQLTALCKASADRLRLLILRVLYSDSYGVLELCTIFDTRQSGMSHHLKILSKAGLLTTRREGNSIFYRRAQLLADNKALHGLQKQLLDTVKDVDLPIDISYQIDKIHSGRKQQSQDFFSDNADKFRAQQDLIASYEQYAETVQQMLANRLLGQRQLALEVGPGDGQFLSFLSPNFRRVVALDNANNMLDQARQLATENNWTNIEFIHGDTSHDQISKLKADCIVVNMVLHHTPSPADIFQDLANILGDSGTLLITDLCHHDQDWAKEACGDLWQGFEPEDLTAWAAAAGLSELDSAYLAQRNGFRIQVRLFGLAPVTN